MIKPSKLNFGGFDIYWTHHYSQFAKLVVFDQVQNSLNDEKYAIHFNDLETTLAISVKLASRWRCWHSEQIFFLFTIVKLDKMPNQDNL